MKLPEPKIKILKYLWLSKQKQEGFTLLELLVAILTLTLFVALSLQGMVLASLAQIRAREKAEASLIIQQNLEAIRVAAKAYDPSESESESEFRARCNGIGGASKNEGLAAGLSATISDIPATFKATASNRSYPFTRTLTPSTTNKNVLSIRYNITDSLTSNTLAELYTEIIPDASFKCP